MIWKPLLGCLSILMLSLPHLWGQSEIGGVINRYSRVVAQGPCPDVVEVGDVEGFFVGQRVLLMVMQGGTMTENNDPTFGQVTAQGLSAGSYFWTTITGIQGNSVTLEHNIPGDLDLSGTIQLVSVPHYENVVVSSELSPQPWDGATGGIVALEVEGTLSLQADINATGAGFRGAVSVEAADDVCTFLTSAEDYYYESGNWRGAPKGEGVIPFVAGKEYGRGPQANGGGGSNTHNAGGGGGGNLARGGSGGENRDPLFARCKGYFPGLGGLALPVPVAAERLFPGGGGGAGHRNNEGNSSGGNGGGIILIKAQRLEFAGGVIRSDGMPGSSKFGDGAGAGGAGGTILIEVENVTGAGTISAAGGSGGNVENNNTNRCMGPGGGGSGGQVYSTQAVNPIVTGGQPGLSQDSDSCPESSNGAQAGADGAFVQAGIFPVPPTERIRITSLSGDTLVCPGTSLRLTAEVEAEDDDLEFQWLSLINGNWEALTDAGTISGSQSSQLQLDQVEGTASFFLMISSSCGDQLASDTIEVSVDLSGEDLQAGFTYSLDGLNVQFANTSVGAQSYQWLIEGIPSFSSQMSAPSFTFPDFGSYQVILEARNSCAVDSTMQTITVGGPPQAGFSGEQSGAGCVPMVILWTNESTGVYDQYSWVFPGGEPAVSEDPNPVVTYNSPGTFDVKLTVSGPLGVDSLIKEGIVKTFSVPQPGFSYQINDLEVSFASTAQAGQLRYSWSFGDGTGSLEKDPVHTYSEPGAYDVTMNLLNGNCGRSYTETVLVFPSGTRENDIKDQLQISPNPTSGNLRIVAAGAGYAPMHLRIFSTTGQLLYQKVWTHSLSLDISDFPAGVYLLWVRSEEGGANWKIIKQ